MRWFDRWIALRPSVLKSVWLRRDVQDGALLLAVAGAAYGLAHFFNVPRWMLTLTLEHPRWEIDEILFLAMVLMIAAPVYGVRRYNDFTREMTGRLRAEREARMLSGHDHLTGLPNERFFARRLDGCLVATSDGHRVAVLVVAVCGFKRIVDLHGHVVGDTILIDISRRIAELLREDTVLARTGSETFALAMPKIDSLDEPATLARRIAITMAQPFLLNDTAITMGVSIGIAVAPDDGATSATLIQHAERALVRDKNDARSTIRFFEVEMDVHINRRITMEGRLRKAVEHDAIIPYYQPLVSLANDRVVGFEALARWNDDLLGEVSPSVFIPLAEEIGLIDVLGKKLFRRACEDMRQWPGDVFMAFNVSAIQLADPDLVPDILAVLAQHGIAPPRLEIEITESALMDHVDEARCVMENLRSNGVHIVLDDFGTGYATLAQLLSFPLDKIKIDRRFVTNVVNDHESLVVVRAIVGLAHGFGLQSVAEGIEGPEQLSCLRRNGCTQGQGYWFGKAVPPAAIAALLATPHTYYVSGGQQMRDPRTFEPPFPIAMDVP